MLVALLAGLLATSSGAVAASSPSAPTSLPGPPPGAGTGAGAPPAPAAGAPPAAQPVGPPSSIPGTVSGPGLLGGSLRLHGRKLPVPLACHGNGSASLTVASMRKAPLAHGKYTCQKGRANLSLTLPAAYAHRFGSPVIGSLTLGGSTYSVTVSSKGLKPAFWTNGGLQCNLYGADTPYLVAPNFHVTPAAVIDVRPWVAFYTAANGWRWLGTGGVNKSDWYQWTAGPDGVSSWLTPTGALNPWTWAPINVRSGRGIYAIGVFEIEYMYFHPTYGWGYARSQTAASSTPTTYCAFP